MPPRQFASAAAIVRVGEGLLACDLPRAEWTHEAHLAACLYLLTERPDIAIDTEIGGLIRRYNESLGGINDDHQGYHETITRVFLAGVREYLAQSAEADLLARVNGLLVTPMGQRDWPLRFYSRDRLFCVAARREFLAPDLAPLP